MAEIGYERIWGVTDSEWESILRYLGAAYRPRVEYNQDPLLLATRTIQEMKAQVAAALAVIDILSTSVALRRGEEHVESFGEMKRHLSYLRTSDR